MGLSLQFIVVFFALAATFSLTFANHYNDGRRIDEVKIEGEFYCSSDGNKQSSSTRRLSRAKISLSCNNGVTILYEGRTEHDGDVEIEIKNQTIVDTILDNYRKCPIFVSLPVDGCLVAPSNGFFQAYLDLHNIVGPHAHFILYPSYFVSCL